MGFKKNWEVGDITSQVHSLAREISSPYNDGYTTFEIKKDLHKLKWLLDEIMADSPTFVGEDDFLKEHEQTKMWRTLSK